MAGDIVWVEDNESRTATIVRVGRKATSTYVKSWKLFGSSDDTAIHDDINNELTMKALFWNYPGDASGNSRLQADSYTLEYLGGEAWHLTVSYSKEGAEDDEQDEPIRRSRSFDTSGGQEHITQAIAGKVSEKGKASNVTDGDNVIGFDGQNVNGVDIIVPQLAWQENYEVPSSYVKADYIKKVSQASGTTNNGDFRGFKKGEVLFLGCSGSQEWDKEKGDGPWALTYKFSVSPNAGSGETLGPLKVGEIDGIEKKGHEYLNTYYEDDVRDNKIWKVPKIVWVHQVYRESNFADLGIGTDTTGL
jgi:hypothetical protein